MTSKLKPQLEEFKAFVKQHPKIIQEVRAGNKKWQEFYEDWYLMGPEDDYWNQYRGQGEKQAKARDEKKSTSKKGDFMSQLLTSLKNVDVNQVQSHITNVSNAITSIQGVISQFQSPSAGKQQQNQQPFSFRKD